MVVRFVFNLYTDCYKMNKLLLSAIITLSIIAGWTVYYVFLYPYIHPNKNPEVCINHSCFEVDIAKDAQSRAKGLMFVESMPSDKWMLFVFETSDTYNFWMKNTLIPLDMIWINEEKKITYIKHAAQPCPATAQTCEVYGPSDSKDAALYVLEINTGLAEKYGFKIGEGVEIRRQ